VKQFLMAAVAACLGSIATAQQGLVNYWQGLETMPEAVKAQPAGIRAFKYHSWQLKDAATLKNALAAAPMEFTPEGEMAPIEFPIPRPDGTFSWFTVVEAPVMEPGLEAQLPGVKTYRGQGLDDPAATVRLDFTPLGFHASVLSPNGSYYVDPFSKDNTEYYSSYFLTDLRPASRFVCYTPDLGNQSGLNDDGFDGGYGERVSGTTLRTFQLAMAATGEFTGYYGGNQASAQAGLVTGVNRMNQVWENECAIRFVLVANNLSIVYTDTTTDPYTGGDLNAMLGENQTNLNAVIGTANYDIGHVVSGLNLGGLAQLSVVCNNSRARGATGLSVPAGDFFWVSYVSHELGHQFGATHSFNSNTTPCTGNRTGATAYEPGSGVTIMSYANNCGSDSYQSQSSPYFHTASYDQIIAHASSRTCDTETATGNSVPTANAGSDRTIPIGTLFSVNGIATDANGDALTYCWEQLDAGPAQTLAEMLTTDNGTSPIFRSYPASTNSDRTFPRYSNALSNSLPIGERYPGAARTLDLRFTVRDNRSAGGGVNADTVVITVRADAGPFAVTVPSASGIAWNSGSQQTITWDVANTSASPINATAVNILLSTDGGNTFPITLAQNTPNDGSQVVTLPELVSTACRIRIEPTNNIFFDISNSNFSIRCDLAPLPSSLQATDGTLCDRVDLTWNAAAGATGYEILRNTINLGSTATTIGSSTTNTYSDFTASPGVSYFYFVRSTNECGSSGVSISNAGFRGTGIASPTGVAASDGSSCSSVSVTWSAAAGATSYQIWRSATNNAGQATQIGSIAASPFTDTTASTGQIFYYFVAATGGCGTSTLSSGDAGSTAVAAGAPSAVTATESNCGNVQVSWTAGAAATGYEVFRASTNTFANAVIMGTPSASPFTDGTAVPGTTYFYWVRSTNACGASAASGPDSGQRLTTPDAPSAIVATDSSLCDRVDISWSPVAGTTSYTVIRSSTNNAGSGTAIGTPTGASFADTTGSAGTTYFYFVSATNPCGNSATSSGDQGTRAQTPAAPTALAATDSTNCDQIDISWAASAGATSYEVFRAASDSSALAVSLGITTNTAFADSSAPSGVTHFYFAKAINTCGASAFSLSDSGTRGGTPAAPTAAQADRTSLCSNDPGSITLTAIGATGTTRWYAGTCGGAEIGTGPSLLLDSPTSTTTYFVRNSTSCGDSDCASVTVTVTPAAEPPASIDVSRNNLCADDSGTIQLSALGGSGTTLRWYRDSCNGVAVGTGNPLSIESPLSTTAYFARWENSCGASDCASATVTVVPTPSIAQITLSNGPTYALGDATLVTVTLSAPAPAAGASVTISSPAFNTIGLSVPGGALSGNASVTLNNYGLSLQAIATGASCASGSAASSSFDVIGGPVIFVDPAGTDSNPGTSAAQPVQSVAAAISRVAPGGTILIAPGSYTTHATIDRSVSILGDSATTTTLTGSATGRVLDISAGHSVTLRNLALINGQASGDGGGARTAAGSSLTIIDCIFDGNLASGRGGAIDALGGLVVSGSTISANLAQTGGGIAVSGPSASVTNTTVSNNSAGSDGGGLWLDCSTTALISHSTIAFNSATSGGGLHACPTAVVQLASSILADNTASSAPDAAAALASLGTNLIANASGTSGTVPSDILGQSALLLPLADNGGPTPTHALSSGSPAVDAADPGCSLPVDQRGISRPLDGNSDTIARCDIGAFELNPAQCPWQTAGCAADYDNSGGVDGDDVIAFFAEWDMNAACADVDLSQTTDGDDVILFFSLWDAGGC